MTAPAPGAAEVPDDVVLARAYLNGVAEPADVGLWRFVREHGPVAAAARVRERDHLPEDVAKVTLARHAAVDPHANLDAAARLGIRLVVPESADWPHFAMACLEHAGRARLATFDDDPWHFKKQGEPVPPLAMWVAGPAELSTLGTRSVAIVGSRAATGYGVHVSGRLANRLAEHDVTVVSGGAFGIDAAAHGGALAAGGVTVLVSAGGLDGAYPSSHDRLFRRVADTGLLISECPPAAEPQRRRFLTRNRLVVALSAGVVVVEAAVRSGALNSVSHAGRLGRPIMAVPGSVESAMSAGCHNVLRNEAWGATLVTGLADVLDVIGAGSGDGDDQGHQGDQTDGRARRGTGDRRRRALDDLDHVARSVFDGFPAERVVYPDDLVSPAGVPIRDVLRALPALELAGLITTVDGGYRITP